MTNHQTCTAHRVFKMKTDAPDADALIALADELAPNGLDSLDLGDAMGEFIRILQNTPEEDGEPRR